PTETRQARAAAMSAANRSLRFRISHAAYDDHALVRAGMFSVFRQQFRDRAGSQAQIVVEPQYVAVRDVLAVRPGHAHAGGPIDIRGRRDDPRARNLASHRLASAVRAPRVDQYDLQISHRLRRRRQGPKAGEGRLPSVVAGEKRKDGWPPA